MAKSVERRLEELEAARGGDLADVDCTIFLQWEDDGPAVWQCRNTRTGEPVEATPAVRAAIKARAATEPATVTIDWGEDPTEPAGQGRQDSTV